MMGTKRRIAIVSIELLILVGVIVGVGYGIYTGIQSMPPPPKDIDYRIDIPSHANATAATYFLKDNTGFFGGTEVYDNHSDKEMLPYTITGHARNNTRCTLDVKYFIVSQDPITGSNAQPTILYQQIAEQTYELTIQGP